LQNHVRKNLRLNIAACQQISFIHTLKFVQKASNIFIFDTLAKTANLGWCNFFIVIKKIWEYA